MWVIYALLILILAIVGLGWALSSPGYDGPVTDNFDGTKFQNRDGYEEKGFLDLLKWMSNREPGSWTELTEDVVEYGPKPAERVTGNRQVITYINHATFLIQTDGLNIITDPVYSRRVSPFPFAGPKRMRPPGIRYEDLPPIDVILISHNHYDHLDINTLKRLTDDYEPYVITPLGVDKYLNKRGIHKTISLNWWEDQSMNSDVIISAVEAQHFSSRGLFDRDKTLWAGYVIQSPLGNIYFAGDTGYNDFFRKIGNDYQPIRTALIPIGAYKPRWFMGPVHVDPAQAIQIHKDVRARLSIGMHYGTFPLADDGQMDPVNDLKDALSGERFILLKEGDSIPSN